jgi:hypothetical protein
VPGVPPRAGLALLIAVGCGDESVRNVPGDGASADPPVDAGRDGARDAGPGPDAVPDDLGADFSPDAAADAGGDAGADAAADSGSFDLGPDFVPDAAWDLASDSAADTGSTDGAGDGGCAPLAADPGAIGDNCEGPPGQPDPTACPAGYECIPFAGFVGTFTCEIRCAQTCECPPPSTCGQRCDKVGCIDACVP